jgi:hypothetical protein
VRTIVSSSQKEKMLSLSSRNENKATKGFFGRISGIFESLLMDTGEYVQIASPYDLGIMPLYSGMGGMTTYFSLSSYQSEMSKTAKKEDWNDQKKSIIAALAKDMVIGVKNKNVEMIAVIDF